MEHSVNVRLDQGYIRSVKTGRGVRLGCCLSPTAFSLYIEEALGDFGDFRIRGKVICAVKYADGLALLVM